jgi:hypothetical protein
MNHTIKCICLALLCPLLPAAAQDLSISGLFNSTASVMAGAGGAEAFSWGVEEYANLRLSAGIGDQARLYGALNLIAAAGSPLAVAEAAGAFTAASAYSAGGNYASAMELERLYFQASAGAFDLSAGLMPLRFGYGRIFGPSDFLNPRSPLFPEARPRGVLGASASWYPASARLAAFAAAPKRLLEAGGINSAGKGFRFGIAGDNDWRWGSIQALSVFETPRDGASEGRLHIGFSLKAEAELGLAAEALYTHAPGAAAEGPSISGLAASAGADYSFFAGDLYLLIEYLYSGAASITARSEDNPGGFGKRHYAYALCQYRFSDYTRLSLSGMAGIEDASFLPALSLYHELFQGMTLTLTARFPLASEADGEFSPQSLGRRFDFTAEAGFRF